MKKVTKKLNEINKELDEMNKITERLIEEFKDGIPVQDGFSNLKKIDRVCLRGELDYED